MTPLVVIAFPIVPDLLDDQRFKTALREGRQVAGTFVTAGGPATVEICGAAGLDFVILDTEHTPVGWETLAAMTTSALLFATFPIIRVGTTRQDLVTRALDTGARGVMFPQVADAAEALVAARSCRYPPDGTRGAASTRIQSWGLGDSMRDYAPRANESVVCIVQLESASAIAQVDEIAAVPGIDCLFVGLADLSMDLGHPAELRHPDVDAALDRVIEAATRNAVPIGIPLGDLDHASEYVERGVTLFTTTDRGVMAKGMSAYRSRFPA